LGKLGRFRRSLLTPNRHRPHNSVILLDDDWVLDVAMKPRGRILIVLGEAHGLAGL
jgi:hypothetical protein